MRLVLVGLAALVLAIGGQAAVRPVVQPGQSWDAAYDAAQPGDEIPVAAGNHGAQSLSGTKIGKVTFRVLGPVSMTSLSIAATNVEVDAGGTSSGVPSGPNGDVSVSGTFSVSHRPTIFSNVTVRGVNARDYFLRDNGIQTFGGSVGGFEACQSPAQDGLRYWSDSETHTKDIVVRSLYFKRITRVGCSEHADSVALHGGENHKLIDASMTEGCPTECIIARPSSPDKVLKGFQIIGGNLGPVLNGSQVINLGSNDEYCENMLVDGVTTNNQVSTFDCDDKQERKSIWVRNSTLRMGQSQCAVVYALNNVYLPGSGVCPNDSTPYPGEVSPPPPPPPPPPVNEPPVACFTRAPNPSSAGQLVTFDASCSSDPNGDALTYTWDIAPGGDGIYERSGLSVQYAYSSAGTKKARVRVSDGVFVSGLEQAFTVNP